MDVSVGIIGQCLLHGRAQSAEQSVDPVVGVGEFIGQVIIPSIRIVYIWILFVYNS